MWRHEGGDRNRDRNRNRIVGREARRGERIGKDAQYPARRWHEREHRIAGEIHVHGQVLPLPPAHSRYLGGQLLEQACRLAPMLLGDTAHDEDGGGGELGVGRCKLVEAVRRHFGVLEETELVLELGQLPCVATGATLVEFGTELE